ncbi:alpha/beta fold hydrolase [soil metagenome]|jgi:pimeloyl-ACP methyl ester carboxylesterase
MAVETVAVLHGNALSYVDTDPAAATRTGPDRPVILFIHGILGSHHNWAELLDELSADARVIAPDLFGHGASAKPMGDYSLGAHAGALRDLLDQLGVADVTLVGHSLGGGIAMQFSYLFPDRVNRLVLISSGGLGREVSLFLRAAVLPGSELVLPILASRWVRDRVRQLGRLGRAVGVHAPRDLAESWREMAALNEPESRRAFLATARSVLDVGGQTVYAGNRFELVDELPVLIVWGARDPIIPFRHGIAAHAALPHSTLELFERAGHFPHLDDPRRFVRVLRAFLATPAMAN